MSRVDWRRTAADQLLPLLGLAGFGFALPLLDLLGSNPEFLVGHYLTGGSLVLFAVALATVPPLLAVLSVAAVGALSAKAGRVLWSVWILAFATLATGSLLRSLDLPSDALQVVLAVVGGGLVLFGALRWKNARLGLSFLAITPVFAVVALMTWSRAADLVWDADPGAIDGVVVDDPAPVVVLQLDELPLSSLVSADGTINAERFPNFARLAEQSTWFANAVAIAPSTTASVPAAVTGDVPIEGELPTAADHPENLFTLLGGSYDLQVDEPVTAMCPRSLCAGSVDWGALANDAVGVAGQLWLPAGLRGRLPSEVQADLEAVDALGGDSARERQERAFAAIDTIEAGGDRPLLWYQHVVLPHVPWTQTRTGAEYRTGPGLSNGPTEAGDWDEDPVRARVGLQRHLLQVGATDRLLGRLIDRLEGQGMWDDALVAVVADHGVAFDPDRPFREPNEATAQEIYRIPLFVKQPGQTQGDTRLDLAYNVDLLPTIMDVLGVELDAERSGRSIVEPVTDRGPDAALYVADLGDAIHPVIDFDQIMAVVRRNADLLGPGQGWHGVVAGGPLGERVGTPVDDLPIEGTSPLTWQIYQSPDLAAVDTETTGALPAFISATIGAEDRGEEAPTDVLVALNGTVAGTLSRMADGVTYIGVLDEELVAQGTNEVEILVPTDADGATYAPATVANP